MTDEITVKGIKLTKVSEYSTLKKAQLAISPGHLYWIHHTYYGTYKLYSDSN